MFSFPPSCYLMFSSCQGFFFCNIVFCNAPIVFLLSRNSIVQLNCCNISKSLPLNIILLDTQLHLVLKSHNMIRLFHENKHQQQWKKWLKNTDKQLVCCGASVASKQQRHQDSKGLCRRGYELSNSSLFTRMHCATFYQRMSHRRGVLGFPMDSSEPSKPLQCSDRILIEVGGVPLNLSLGSTPWFDSTLRNKG